MSLDPRARASRAGPARRCGKAFAVTNRPADACPRIVAAIPEAALPEERRGRMARPEVTCSAVSMAAEGERDHSGGIGRAMAAPGLGRGVPVKMRRHHLQAGTGHCGAFHGRCSAQAIDPLRRGMIRANEG
jgi:poly(3-hydroxybutyrate) depolymerase